MGGDGFGGKAYAGGGEKGGQRGKVQDLRRNSLQAKALQVKPAFAGVEGGEDCAIHAKRLGVQRRNPHGRNAQAQGQPARCGDRYAHTREIARPRAHADARQITKAHARLGQHLGQHGHQAFGLALFHRLVPLGQNLIAG